MWFSGFTIFYISRVTFQGIFKTFILKFYFIFLAKKLIEREQVAQLIERLTCHIPCFQLKVLGIFVNSYVITTLCNTILIL